VYANQCHGGTVDIANCPLHAAKLTNGCLSQLFINQQFIDLLLILTAFMHASEQRVASINSVQSIVSLNNISFVQN
jgi:hypothetical protein